MGYFENYSIWLENANDAIRKELLEMNETEKEDAFFRNLSFGTGGLRGLIGAGTNRMNVYVVAKASQGLANYLTASAASPSVVIGYDSRIMSDVFAKTAAEVLVANGIHVHYWKELLPVPTVRIQANTTDIRFMVLMAARLLRKLQA